MTEKSTAIGDPVGRFEELVAAEMAKGTPRAKAVIKVGLANPALHAEYVKATQTTAKTSRLASEKYG